MEWPGGGGGANMEDPAFWVLVNVKMKRNEKMRTCSGFASGKSRAARTHHCPTLIRRNNGEIEKGKKHEPRLRVSYILYALYLKKIIDISIHPVY
eukprot:7009493-Ditylum_brightwellii.AAC.1